jgi:hypothetical protein
LLAAAAGLVLGGIPLLAVNAITYLRDGRLVSLALAGARPDRTFDGFLRHLWNYATVAPGQGMRGGALASATPQAELLVEGYCLLLIAALITTAGWTSSSAWGRRAVALLFAWAGVGVALFALPAATSAHHWVVGTPFQYLGIAAGALALLEDARARRRWALARLALFGATFLALTAGRVLGLAETERALLAGRNGWKWHHDYTALGELGRAAGAETAFVASDWGVATQIYCLANGRADHVYEPFWDYHGIEDLQRIAGAGKKVIYVVRPEPAFDVKPANTRRIERDAEALPSWREAGVDAAFARLTTLRIRKYVREP